MVYFFQPLNWYVIGNMKRRGIQTYLWVLNEEKEF